jgi:hypothetical protein
MKPLAIVVLLALAACGRADQQKSDKTNATDSPNTPRLATVSAARGAAAALPGTLVKAIDQYTGDELYAFAHGLTFTGGNERERRCRGNASCRGATPGQRTRVRVDAVDQQDSLSAGAVPVNGVIAVRANNAGAMADSMYNMKPGARYEYYLIVLPGTGGRASWRLEELDVTQGSRAHRSVATGLIRECNHPFVRGARADFKSCATAATVRPASFKMLQDVPEEPIWYGCSSGCCTADPNDGRA